MSRVFLLVLDSFGVGAADDAAAYGDTGSDTLGHIADACIAERGKPLHVPNLCQLGLQGAATAARGKPVAGLDNTVVIGAYGYAQELSVGKDTPSGHWEMAGLPVTFDWGMFSPEYPSFPDALIQAFCEQAKVPGIIGNRHASGTQIIEELGEEHVKTGKPICYTSGDSVFQIAAHEESFGLDRLYECCEIARKLVDDYQIGRVIARPFTGEIGAFKRTPNRRDYATPPHGKTLLDVLVAEDREVIAVGKIADIFAHRGISRHIKAEDNDALFTATLDAIHSAPDGSLVFSNFVDFDSKFGHRRDPLGYAAALEAFDQRLPELLKVMKADDLLVLSADHGCDPTWPGSDHTREYIPVLMYQPDMLSRFIGKRDSFADIGQTVAKHLNVSALQHGKPIL
ncbi:MAG: phosphopentomutase [marine bacterium B5-7]|nr:MAG: phosphopentomutase [marine bacterium B5-7]